MDSLKNRDLSFKNLNPMERNLIRSEPSMRSGRKFNLQEYEAMSAWEKFMLLSNLAAQKISNILTRNSQEAWHSK